MKFVKGFVPYSEGRSYGTYVNADKIIGISPVSAAMDGKFWVYVEFDGGSRMEVEGSNDVYSYKKTAEIVRELEKG